MPFCSRASLLRSRAPRAQPCCLGRSRTGGHQASGFAGDGSVFPVPRAGMELAGQGKGRAEPGLQPRDSSLAMEWSVN